MSVLPEREDLPIVDKDELTARVFGKKTLLEKIVGIFVNTYKEMLSAIHQSIKNGDSNALDRAAHALKGVLSNLASASTANLAFQLEMMGKKSDLTGAEELYNILEQEVERLKQALLECLDGMG